MINDELIIKMTEFNAGDSKRIQHFIKVYEFAHVIGVKEQLEEQQLRILDMAAIMHDIGIRPSEEKYGRCDGKLQGTGRTSVCEGDACRIFRGDCS